MFNRFSHLESFGKCVFRLRVRAEEIESRRLTLRLLLITNRNICLEKCFLELWPRFTPEQRAGRGLTPWNALLYSLRRFQGIFPFLDARSEFLCIDRSRFFLDKIFCLAKIRTASNEKRENALEPPQWVEQMIPRRQTPPSYLFGRKTRSKLQKSTFPGKYFCLL